MCGSDCGCGCDDTVDTGAQLEIMIAYDKLQEDLNTIYLRKNYAEILERLETEFPVDLAGISKLKLSE